MKRTANYIMMMVLVAGSALAESALQDKTLVAWVALANLTQRGGSVLTISGKSEFSAPFDGIVYSEITPAKWMAGSDNSRRTQRMQESWPTETAGSDTLVQIAIVYNGNLVTTYRDGKEYSRHTIRASQAFGSESVVVIGQRHPGARNFFAGAIDDARIYDSALTAEQLAALKPNESSEPAPWAWWTFDDAACTDRAGRFASTQLADGATVEGGRLLLDGKKATFYAACSQGALGKLKP